MNLTAEQVAVRLGEIKAMNGGRPEIPLLELVDGELRETSWATKKAALEAAEAWERQLPAEVLDEYRALVAELIALGDAKADLLESEAPAMSFEDTIRQLLREELRGIIREELTALGRSSGRPELLTYAQAAELVGVGVSTIKQWVKDAVLPVYGAASSRRVRPADVVAVFKRVDAKAARDDLAPERQAAKILSRRVA